jgi:hypothetical protein
VFGDDYIDATQKAWSMKKVISWALLKLKHLLCERHS